MKTMAKTTDSRTFLRAIRCFFTTGLMAAVSRRLVRLDALPPDGRND
jgi:hypothetical protein